MANLLDTIKNRLGSTSAQVAPELGKTEQTSKLLRAKTGKASAPESGPRASALGERVVAGQARLGAEQLQADQSIKAAQQSEQSADIEQREDLQRQQFEQQRQLKVEETNMKAQNLLDDYVRSNKKIDTKKDVQNIEQIGISLRLQNEQYVNQLKTEGTKSLLDDMSGFKQQYARNTFADQDTLLSNERAFNRILDLDDDAFEREMGQMGISHAQTMADEALLNKNSQEKWKAIGKMASAATAGAAQASKSMALKDKDTDKDKDTEDKDTEDKDEDTTETDEASEGSMWDWF